MPNKTESSKPKNYTYAVGRRKTATCRVRLFTKKGDNLINDQSVSAYFPSTLDQQFALAPLALTSTQTEFSFTAKIAGSGSKSQRGALSHALARALCVLDTATYRSPLKKAGLLTRDPRMRQSRQVGTGGKARRKKQSPKR
jgi:small subunit ribosomal protein S9